MGSYKMKRRKFYYKIYQATSPSGKHYIGQTIKTIQLRWRGHIQGSVKGNLIIDRAIRKYGASAFSITCIDLAENRHDAGKLETFYIKKLNTIKPNGYNMTLLGCGGVPGTKRTKEFRERLSKNKIEFYSNPANRKAQSIRITQIYNTPEGKEKQRKRALLQNKPETKMKIKRKLKQLRSSPEYRKAKSIEQKRIWQNPILRKKHSTLLKKIGQNPILRKKHSKIMKEIWKKRKLSKANTKKKNAK